MPGRTSRNFGRGRQGSRPNRSWSGLVSASATSVPPASKVLVGTFALSVPSIDETILRTRGVLGVRSDQVAAEESQFGAFGLMVVTDVAAAAGIASIPGPGTDVSDDGWFVWLPIMQTLKFGTAVGFDTLAMTQIMIDSSAKRIIQEGQLVAIVAENVHANQAFEIAVGFRILSQVRGTR